MKVLIADRFSEDHIRQIESLAISIAYEPNLTEADLPKAAGDATILVVRSTPVNAKTIEAAPRLGLIIRAGAGYNTIDVAAAARHGIYVANCPGKNSIAVAELTLGLILAIDRRIPDNVLDLREGRWNKREYSHADGLFGKTYGLVGIGQIGQEVLHRIRPLGMRIVGWSRSLTPERARALDIGRCETLADLVRQSDVISIHLALAPATERLFNEEIFDLMKPRTILINTARGEIVDEKALRKAISEKHIRVGLDVYADEPKGPTGKFADNIVQFKEVYGTHHIGASTEQAQSAIGAEVVRIITHYLETGEVLNCVNVARRTPARCQLIVRHFDRVGVLADVLQVLKRHKLNIQEMSNTIFDGALAASCKIMLDDVPSSDAIREIASRKDDIIHVDLVEI